MKCGTGSRYKGNLGVFVAVLVVGCGPSGGDDPTTQASKAQSRNNLNQIGIALIQVHENNNQLPSANGEMFMGVEGVSWRFHILHYIEQANVYNLFRAQGPGKLAWDNPKLLDIRIPQFDPVVPGKTQVKNGTFYRAFVGKGTGFDPTQGGQHFVNKLLIVEAGEAVPWPKPEELAYDADKPLPPLGGLFASGFHGVYGDGEVRFFPKDTDEKTLRAAITGTYANGERPGKKVE